MVICKRILLILTCVLLASLLWGCGNSNNLDLHGWLIFPAGVEQLHTGSLGIFSKPDGIHSNHEPMLQSYISIELDVQKLLLVATMAILLVMAIYHLVLYKLRCKDPSALYFALYCLTWIVGTMTHPQEQWFAFYLFGDLPAWLIWRVELCSYFMSVPVILLFFRCFFPKEVPGYLPVIYLVLALLFCLALYWMPFSSKKMIEGIFHLFALVAIIWGGISLVRALRCKRQGAVILFYGFLSLAVFGINDILHDTGIIDTGYYLSVGLLLFIMAQAFSLANRFSRAFTTSEELSAKLQENNIALAKLDKMKDQFLANTSHELRTPLSGIIGIAESLLAGAAGSPSTAMKENLTMLAASGKHLSGLVNDILDYSRLRNRKLRLSLRAIDLRTLVDTVLTVLEPLAARKGLSLKNELSPETPVVMGDENRLQQIFYNLMGNAIKFTEQGSITVAAVLSGQELEIAVTDTGIGIPIEKQQTIFLSFEQVDVAADREYGGAGLGLAITKHLVKLHGGVIRVESAPGRGACFLFTLPLAAEELCQQEPFVEKLIDSDLSTLRLTETTIPVPSNSWQQAHDGALASILVVDDDLVNLQVAFNHLTLVGYQVRTATRGAEALAILNTQGKPDLILLDIMMPAMSGYEACRLIRETQSALELPVIMLTAKNRMSDLVFGFESGANDYLTKPFSREELLARVQSQLKLREAYFTLEENLCLKEQLRQQEQTMFGLHITQRRLARMLDTVDDAVLAVGEDERLCFVNRKCAVLLGAEEPETIGQQVETLFEPASQWTATLLSESEGDMPSGHRQCHCTLRRVDGNTIEAAVLVTHLQLDEEILTVLVIKPGVKNNGAEPLPVLTVIEELNRNRERVHTLEEGLNKLPLDVLQESPALHVEMQKIDVALAQLSTSLLACGDQAERGQLVVKVMSLSVEYWTEATGENQAELARRSGLWTVHTNDDGWQRTRTMTRYLSTDTVPARPRLKPVIRTADYVLTACQSSSPRREELEVALARLQAM